MDTLKYARIHVFYPARSRIRCSWKNTHWIRMEYARIRVSYPARSWIRCSWQNTRRIRIEYAHIPVSGLVFTGISLTLAPHLKETLLLLVARVPMTLQWLQWPWRGVEREQELPLPRLLLQWRSQQRCQQRCQQRKVVERQRRERSSGIRVSLRILCVSCAYSCVFYAYPMRILLNIGVSQRD